MNPVSPDALARSRFIDADRLTLLTALAGSSLGGGSAMNTDIRKWLGVAV